MKLYCSDIHEDDDPAEESGEYSIFQLKFLQPFLTNDKDADDDLVKITKYHLPFLPGKLAIDDVGFQIWRASFFLSEYLLDHPQMLKGKCVVELGAGSALPSMIARHYCEEVTATDLDHVLKVTRKSIELNHDALNVLKPIRVSECSWDDPNGNILSRRFDVCIAADVCYSHLTTMKFFRMIKNLLRSGTRRILVSLEERPNFMTDTMSVESTERDRFLKHIAHLQQTYPITCQYVPTSSVNQYFLYERTKRLALYDIKVNVGCSTINRAPELYNSVEQ